MKFLLKSHLKNVGTAQQGFSQDALQPSKQALGNFPGSR